MNNKLSPHSPTRRTAPHENTSAVDLSICTPNLASLITWRTLSSTFGSDHFPIVISLPTIRARGITRTPRLKYVLNNDNLWDRFKTCVEEKLNNIANFPHMFTNCTEVFSNILTQTADEIFPLKNSASALIPSPPW